MIGEKSLFIAAGWLIDGTGGPIRSDVLIEIENGVISTINKMMPGDRDNRHFVDLTRCTLLPGLIDSHVHLTISGTEDPEVRQDQLTASFEILKGVIDKHLKSHVSRGVVALRDGGDHGGYTLYYKSSCLPHAGIPIRLKSAGRAWHAPGRYGKLIGRPPVEGHTLGQSILKQLEPVDHIKIVNSGLNSLTAFGKETPSQFDPDELKEAVQAGRKLDLKTMVHANGREAVAVAIEAGCHSIEHGFFMGEKNLIKMAEREVTWVPTAFTMKAYAGMPGSHRRESEVAQKNLDHQLDQIRKSLEYGVRIAVGTDAGSPGVHHGQAIREEIRLLISAGLSLEEAIQCATSNGADLLGLENEVGRVLPGMPATFLATRGRPGSLPESLDSIERIYVEGDEYCA
jgi:imidazolonepropionase-like amidohydrolase